MVLNGFVLCRSFASRPSRIARSGCFLVFLCPFGLCQTAPPPVLSGVVVNATDSSPIEGATVIVTAEPRGSVAAEAQAAQTGPDGRFTIQFVPAQQYRLTCERSGFVSVSRVYSASVVGTAQGSNNVSSPIEVRMTGQAVVTGQVTDSAGQPLTGATVRVSRVSLSGERTLLSTVTQVSTDDIGHYRIFGLEPGRYYLSAAYQDAGAAMGLRRLPAPDGSRGETTEDYTVTYFPGVSDVESAKPIRLRAGAVASDINLRIGMVQSFQVSGVLTGIPPNTPPPQVFLKPAGLNSLGADRVSIPSPGSSHFRFRSVPSGQYVLMASVRMPEGFLVARQEVAVPSGGDVSLAFQGPFSITGTVTGDGGTDMPAGVKIWLVGMDNHMQADLRIEKGGHFLLPQIGPGEYRFAITDNSGRTFLRSLLVDDHEVPGDVATLPGPGHTLRLVVSDKAGRIDGAAIESDQRPAIHGLAVLVGASPENSRVYAATVGPGGKFAFRSLPPGKYRILCFSDLSTEQDATWDVQQKVEANGKDLTIAESDAQQVNTDVTQLDPN